MDVILLNSEYSLDCYNIKNTLDHQTANTMSLSNIFRQSNQNQCLFSEKTNNYCQSDQDSIQMFLNEDVFINRAQNFKQDDSLCEQSNTIILLYEQRIKEMEETEHNGRKKSIFHNFQKHLITLIKKIIKIEQNQNINTQQERLAYQLWYAFMKSRSFNKKVLHLIFGVESSKLHEEYQKLSNQISQFKKIMNNESLQSILEAQKIIRQQFVSQAIQIGKNMLQKNCKANRFQEFYQYFLSFVCELRNGAMTKRMTKSRKYGVMLKLQHRENQE